MPPSDTGFAWKYQEPDEGDNPSDKRFRKVQENIVGLTWNGREVFVAGQCQATGFLVFSPEYTANELLDRLNGRP